MKQHVVLIEFPIYSQFPLVSGYLQSYAESDPNISEGFKFIYFQQEIGKTSYSTTLNNILKLKGNIICISCYVWNMGFVIKLVKDLHNVPGIEKIILGGHQISMNIKKYFDYNSYKVVVVNGHGEIPFKELLLRLSDNKDLAGVNGLSYFTDGDLQDGGEAPYMKNIDDIPSPFLNGYFDNLRFPISIFETTRGCPFNCSFCTWGWDMQKVVKFNMDRIEEELRWLAKKNTLFLYLADANWGIFQRDVEISQYIGKLKKQYGYPWGIYYAAAKNKPKSAMACIEEFQKAGVITAQAIGIQSMNPKTLELINRKNINNKSLMDMIKECDLKGLSSYVEMIWPLPGETYDTLLNGFDELLEFGVNTIVMYPTLLIANSKLNDQRVEHGIETVDSADWKSELKVVKKTKNVDQLHVDEGFWFYYAYFMIGNHDPTKALLRWMKKNLKKNYSEIINNFSLFLRKYKKNTSYVDLIDSLFESEEHGSLQTIGRLATLLSHSQRFEAQSIVGDYIVKQEELGDVCDRIAFSTLWILSFPKVFQNTNDNISMIIKYLNNVSISFGCSLSEMLEVACDNQIVHIIVKDKLISWQKCLPFFSNENVPQEIRQISIHHHSSKKMPFTGEHEGTYSYAHGMVQRLKKICAEISYN